MSSARVSESLTLLILCAGFAIAQESRALRGTVRDQLGYVVPGAHIVLQGIRYEHAVISGTDGTFRVEGAPRQKLHVTVEAAGFSRYKAELSEEVGELAVVLLPAAVAQDINVTANRIGTSQEDTPERIEVLSSRETDAIASLPVDQSLRLVPGFALFRRSDSRTANPTSQGVSLRGVGGSGASRALVLYDDVPLNDPFGGWVYWGRIVRQELSSLEVLRGGGSSLYVDRIGIRPRSFARRQRATPLLDYQHQRRSLSQQRIHRGPCRSTWIGRYAGELLPRRWAGRGQAKIRPRRFFFCRRVLRRSPQQRYAVADQ